MIRIARPARGCVRARGLAAAAVCAALVLLAACGAAGGERTADDPKAAAGAVPEADVVSGVREDPALRAELPAAARESGRLTLGTTLFPGGSGLPHSGETATGEPVGLDVDLRNAVARVLGIRFTVRLGTFPTIIPGVQNGRYDVGQDNFGVTAARERVVDFATYLDDGQSFLASSQLPLREATSLMDLCGLTVATIPGSTFQQILTRQAARCAGSGRRPYAVEYFSDIAAIFLGLANGRIDVFFGPTLNLRYDAAHVPDTRFLGQVGTMPVGFVTKKGSPLGKVLSDAVNELIANGGYRRILAKWGVGGTAVTVSRVNPPATL